MSLSGNMAGTGFRLKTSREKRSGSIPHQGNSMSLSKKTVGAGFSLRNPDKIAT